MPEHLIDRQQALLIRRMVEDLELSVGIDVAPLIREPDGLALSSRNRYLTEEERQDAVGLSRALDAARESFDSGETRPENLLGRVRRIIERFGKLHLQYAEIVRPSDLAPLERAEDGSVLLVAAYCGRTRLIDNVVLGTAPDPRVSGVGELGERTAGVR